MSDVETVAAVGVAVGGAVSAGLAAFVWSRRQGTAGVALAWMLAALCVWDLAYGAELLAVRSSWRLLLGDLKYLGICALTPAWVVFVLAYTGRAHRVTRRLLAALAVEPLLVLVLLAVPATHDLVRSLPDDARPQSPVAAGPVFWAHLVYSDALLLPATAALVWSLVRRSRAYWLQAAALVAAALLPWAANLAFNLGPSAAQRVDLTSTAFTVSGAVLAWGLLRQRLLRLDPLARSVLVDRLTDAVVVLDAYGHVVDVNPAARALLPPGPDVVGRPAAAVLPDALVAEALLAGDPRELVLDGRTHEVTVIVLPGRRRDAGRLLVLRDVTERATLDRRLRELLAEQQRVAEQLSSSLRPDELPEVPGLRLAAAYRPAGSGREIGGDFYDVVPAGDGWAVTLGDISGKGAKAAAATASARYSLRTLVQAGHGPAEALRRLNAQLLAQAAGGDESYLTAAHGRLRTGPEGAVLTLALGGHPRPTVLRACGEVEEVGLPGSAVGLFPDVDLAETDVRLAPGDAVVLFTDGVSEARQGDALFGEGGLAAALARLAGAGAEGLAAALLHEVLAVQGGAAVDDIAILVLQAEPARVAAPPLPRAHSTGS